MPFEGLPPWLQPADPAAHLAHGLQIGLQMGAHQAAQAFQQQQAARLAQEDAQREAQWQAEFGLQAATAARKSQAMQEYQKRVRGGEDPMKVMLELGPMMGESGTAQAAAMRAPMVQQQQAALQAFREAILDQRIKHQDEITAMRKQAQDQLDQYRQQMMEMRQEKEANKPEMSSSELSTRVRELRAEETQWIGEYGRLLRKDPKLLTPEERTLINQLSDIRAEREALLPRLITRHGSQAATPTAAAAAGSPTPTKWVMGPNGYMPASAPQSASATAAAIAPAPTPPPQPTRKATLPEFVKKMNSLPPGPGYNAQQAAWDYIGQRVAELAGPSAESPLVQIGSSTLHHAPGDVYASALKKGTSDYLPGLTRKKISDYVESLPADTREQIYGGALDAVDAELKSRE